MDVQLFLLFIPQSASWFDFSMIYICPNLKNISFTSLFCFIVIFKKLYIGLCLLCLAFIVPLLPIKFLVYDDTR